MTDDGLNHDHEEPDPNEDTWGDCQRMLRDVERRAYGNGRFVTLVEGSNIYGMLKQASEEELSLTLQPEACAALLSMVVAQARMNDEYEKRDLERTTAQPVEQASPKPSRVRIVHDMLVPFVSAVIGYMIYDWLF